MRARKTQRWAQGVTAVVSFLAATSEIQHVESFTVAPHRFLPPSSLRATTTHDEHKVIDAVLLRKEQQQLLKTTTASATTERRTHQAPGHRYRIHLPSNQVQLTGANYYNMNRVRLVSSSSATLVAPDVDENGYNPYAAPGYDEEEQQETVESTEQEESAALANTDDEPAYDAYGMKTNKGTLSKIQNYQETRDAPKSFGSRLKTMDLQDIVATLVLPSIAVFAGGRYVYNRVAAKVTDRTDDLLDSFAKELIYHDGNFEEMKLCIADYQKRLVWLKIGPPSRQRDSMLKRYLESYVKKKTISPQAISSISFVFNLFNMSEEQAAALLVSLSKQMGTEKVASANKLLFLGSRVLQSPTGKQGLEPIKALIMSSYREASVAETMVETSQQYV
jgi:hypothetical protein